MKQILTRFTLIILCQICLLSQAMDLPSSDTRIREISMSWCSRLLSGDMPHEDSLRNPLLAEIMRDMRELLWVPETFVSASLRGKTATDEEWQQVFKSLETLKKLFRISIKGARGELAPIKALSITIPDQREKFFKRYIQANQAYIRLISKLENLLNLELEKQPKDRNFKQAQDLLFDMTGFAQHAHHQF